MPLINSNDARFTVTVLGFDNALASAITGAIDLFALAGVSWQRIHQQDVTPHFTVQMASHHGQPVRCINSVTIPAHVAIEDVIQSHIVMVPTVGGSLKETLEITRPLHPHIRRLLKNGADIAGNCTGTFLLAESGILDNRVATTHWGYAETFRKWYPNVSLHPDNMLTQDATVFCAGGGVAWFDLALLLIERYCGHQVASETAKSHVLDLVRGHQSLYAGSRQFRFHQDEMVHQAQAYFDTHFAHNISVEQAADHANASSRTLTRRFQQSCNITPGQYLQRIRIEHARKLLERGTLSLERIVGECGYDDISSFSRLFKRLTGLTPSQYRSKFVR